MNFELDGLFTPVQFVYLRVVLSLNHLERDVNPRSMYHFH
jgi:hypothetical protein